jgi:hypothetical protein
MAKLKTGDRQQDAKRKMPQVAVPSVETERHLAMARLKMAEMAISNIPIIPQSLEQRERLAANALGAAEELARQLASSQDKIAQKKHDEEVLVVKAKAWCSDVAALLRRHREGRGELPKAQAIDLELQFESLAAGFMPKQFSDATRRSGARKYHPQERIDIQAAVDYIAAAKAGLFDDKSPAKTIKLRFAVDEKTVRRWVKENKPRDLSSFSNPQEIAFRASQAAAHYSTHGRSAPAINRRGRKR